jgi:hypothetical protein
MSGGVSGVWCGVDWLQREERDEHSTCSSRLASGFYDWQCRRSAPPRRGQTASLRRVTEVGIQHRDEARGLLKETLLPSDLFGEPLLRQDGGRSLITDNEHATNSIE